MMAERGLTLPIRPSCAGCGGMPRVRQALEPLWQDPLVAPGESMRPISRYAANGPTSIERWTSAGQTIDFRLSRTRDVSAAKAFFKKAIGHEGGRRTRSPSTAMPRRIEQFVRCEMGGLLPKRTKLRSSKYLNNLIEQDHRGIKSRTRPMLGFAASAARLKRSSGFPDSLSEFSVPLLPERHGRPNEPPNVSSMVDL
jgi:hypothetical protein